MTYSALPSAPPGRTISFGYATPRGHPIKGDLFGTEQKKEELCQIADRIVNAGTLEGRDIAAVVSGFFIDFGKGSITIDADLGQGDTVCSEIDVMSTKFIQKEKEYIASINPALAAKLENTPCREEAEKITDIYFELFGKYVDEQKQNPGGESDSFWRSSVRSVVPGFKEKRTFDPLEAMSLAELKEEAGAKFKSFIQTLPTSLLSSKKALCFLQAGLDQKASKADKILYLKQVIFLLTFQEVFKDILKSISTDLAISKRMQYTSSACDYNSERIYQDRAQRIEMTLSQLPVHDVLMLIPLACRASFAELSRDGDEPNDPFRLSCYVIEERNRARTADIAFTKVLKDSFGKEVKSFSVPTDHSNHHGIWSIEQFLMGVSGLAISSGPNGRFPMHEHQNIYYARDDITALHTASDNVPAEFLLSAAQAYPERDDTWVEERCLAYLTEMVGRVSQHELDGIKAKINNVRRAVDNLSVDLIKEKSPNQYVLRNSAMEKLRFLCEKAKRESGLSPSSSATKSSCSIM